MLELLIADHNALLLFGRPAKGITDTELLAPDFAEAS